jgi:hypothetical protein
MDLQNIIGLLQHDSRPLERTQFCPADQEIAQYYEAAMPIADCERLQRHILDCAYCEARLGALERLQETGFFPQVDEELIASAKQMAVAAGPQKNLHAPAWAAAAVIILTLSVIILWDSGQYQAIDNNTRQVRNIDQTMVGPRLLSPLEGALVDPGELIIRWSEIPGSLFYTLYILSDAGDLVVAQRVDGSEWSAGDRSGFDPGAEYFVRVEAHLTDASTVSSNHLIFVMRDEN